MAIRTELTGMLPAVITAIEALLSDMEALNPQVVKGYDASAGVDNYFYWGVACRIQCSDMSVLRKAAESAGFLWLSDEGDLAYARGLSIEDFQTYRVNGNLELTPEEKEGM